MTRPEGPARQRRREVRERIEAEELAACQMRLAAVPQDLVLAAAWALADVPDTDMGDGTDEIRAMLAAVLPLHEQQVRTRIMAEIEQEAAHEQWMRGDDE